MLPRFLSIVRQRPAKLWPVRSRTFRHVIASTSKHRRRTKHLFPCVNALKYSGRNTSKPQLSANRNFVPQLRQFYIARGLHTTNRRCHQKQEQDDEVPPVYYIQNPFAWIRNRMQVGRLRSSWDPEFTEDEFIRGAKQVISLITQALGRDDFVALEALTSRQTAAVLHVMSRLWKDEVRSHIALRPEDVRLAVPTRIHFNRLHSTTDRVCEIDAWFVGVKAIARDTFFIVEILARFNRDYTTDSPEDWNVTIFQIRRFNIRSPDN